MKGRHRIYVRVDNHVEYLKWLHNLSTELREGWSSALDLSVRLEATEPAQYTVTVCNVSNSNWTAPSLSMTVKDARLFAVEPFKVFLENDDSDRNFLITFSSKEQKKRIEELELHNLIRFEHCGGIGEIPKRVRRFVKKKSTNSLIASAVFDCDASQPQKPSGQSQNVLSTCEKVGVSAHRLKRRAIENYILLKWLNSWVYNDNARRRAHSKRFTSFCNFSDDQRYHFHMKDGIKKDQNEITGGSNRLYNNLSAEPRGALNDGFGAAVSEIYSWPWVQESEPLQDTDGWNEVNGIVRSLLVLFR